jgi:hypothetical protein
MKTVVIFAIVLICYVYAEGWGAYRPSLDAALDDTRQTKGYKFSSRNGGWNRYASPQKGILRSPKAWKPKKRNNKQSVSWDQGTNFVDKKVGNYPRADMTQKELRYASVKPNTYLRMKNPCIQQCIQKNQGRKDVGNYCKAQCTKYVQSEFPEYEQPVPSWAQTL